MLVDDHRSMLAGLEWIINGHKPEMMVVGTATSRREAIEVCEAVSPDLAVVDLDLQGDNGLELVRLFASAGKPLVLVLTGLRDRAAHREAVIAGARGVLSKEASAETIVKGIRCVWAGELWLDRVTTQEVLAAMMAPTFGSRAGRAGREIDALTPRERQVIVVVATHSGLPTKTIAAALHISEHTLRNHPASIYQKLDVANRLELYQFAQKHGLT